METPNRLTSKVFQSVSEISQTGGAAGPAMLGGTAAQQEEGPAAGQLVPRPDLPLRPVWPGAHHCNVYSFYCGPPPSDDNSPWVTGVTSSDCSGSTKHRKAQQSRVKRVSETTLQPVHRGPLSQRVMFQNPQELPENDIKPYREILSL